jgi:hypothetical protein
MRSYPVNLALVDLLQGCFDKAEQSLSIDGNLPVQDSPRYRNRQTHEFVFRIAPQHGASHDQVLHHSRNLADLNTQLLFERSARFSFALFAPGCERLARSRFSFFSRPRKLSLKFLDSLSQAGGSVRIAGRSRARLPIVTVYAGTGGRPPLNRPDRRRALAHDHPSRHTGRLLRRPG